MKAACQTGNMDLTFSVDAGTPYTDYAKTFLSYMDCRTFCDLGSMSNIIPPANAYQEHGKNLSSTTSVLTLNRPTPTTDLTGLGTKDCIIGPTSLMLTCRTALHGLLIVNIVMVSSIWEDLPLQTGAF